MLRARVRARGRARVCVCACACVCVCVLGSWIFRISGQKTAIDKRPTVFTELISLWGGMFSLLGAGFGGAALKCVHHSG